MQHPTSFFGLSRRANTRHLLFLCLASTFLAAASLYSSLSSFAVQAAGTEGNGGRHAMYTAGASGISGERQQGEQDETALLTGRMYDGEQDQVDAQEAPMELQERSQSHSRSKSDGFFEYGYRSPRLQKKKKMSLLTHLLPALAFVVILNLGAAAVYLHSQKKSLEQLPVQTDAELEKAVTEEAADVAPTPVAPTPVAPTPAPYFVSPANKS